MSVTFSIIVPIYNVEDYLPRCIESVLSQDPIYELILVDDGSPDNSGKIADSYAKNNDLITVIHKENGGLSDARNVGLNQASGEYVIFLDSDDSLVTSSLRVLADRISQRQEIDVYYANVIRTNNGSTGERKHKQNLIPEKKYSGKDALYTEISRSSKYMAMAQAGIYRRSFIEKNKLRFKKGILHEDEEWSPRVELNAESVMYIDIDFYIYLVREGSITNNTKKVKNAQDLISTCHELKELYASIDYEELRKYLECYLAKIYMHAISILKRANERIYVDKKFTHKKWISKKDLIRFLSFEISPYLYAQLIDKNFVD